MRITVAMATFQGERFLAQQLESIAAQSRRPDELLVGDDGSKDGTVAIVEAFATSSPFPVSVRVNALRLGPGRNFESVMRRSAGDVIALADQDDVWHPEKLERIERAFSDSTGLMLAFSDCELVDESSRSLGMTGWDAVGFTDRDRGAIDRGDGFRVLLDRQHRRGGTVTGATMAFRAAARELVLPFPELLPASGKGLLHDAWIALVIAAVADVHAIPELLVRHRQHPGQDVGMRTGSASEEHRRPRRGAAPPLERSLRWMASLRDRLGQLPVGDRRDGAIALVDRWLQHLGVRAGLPPGRARRIAPIARELAAGRYHVYSSGLRSAARDLLR